MKKINNLHYSKHQLKDGLERFVKYAWIMKSYETQSNPDLLIADGYPEIIFVQKGVQRIHICHLDKHFYHIPETFLSKSSPANQINFN